MRVIVAGAVAWHNREKIRQVLEKLPAKSVVIHGDCAGADALGGEIAATLGFTVVAMDKNKEDAQKYGKKEAWKGLNDRMLLQGCERIFIFHPDFAASRGSKHLAECAKVLGIDVEIYA